MTIIIPNTFADKTGQVQLENLDENFTQIASDLNTEVTNIQNQVDASLSEVQATVDSIEDPVAMGLIFGPDQQKEDLTGRYLRQIYTQVDSGTYSTNTTWAVGPTFTNVTGFKANSIIRMSYHMPMRNDSSSWGGGYIEPQVRFDGVTWQSLGSCGYDGGVMTLATGDIGSYFQMLLIDPSITNADFSVQFRFYFRSYDGTVTINGSHDINAISSTATLMSGNNGLQHYAKIVVEELATY